MSSRITTIPLPGDKLEAWRRFASELMGTRRREFDDLNRRYGLSQHRAWMQRRADGSHLLLLLHEGVRADRFLADIASSPHPFDRWMAERFEEIHGHDLAKPLPTDAAALALDWRSEPSMARPRSTPPPPPSARAQSSAPPPPLSSAPPAAPAARGAFDQPSPPPRLRSTPPPLPPSMRPRSHTPKT